MNNAILFFYDIHIPNIKKINDNYYFKYLNNNYGIYLYKRDPNDIIDLYNLNIEVIKNGIISYEIVLTKSNGILFNYEDNLYILMKIPNVNNRFINYEDITNFNIEINNKYNRLDKSNWSNSWSNKIDFIEYQFKQMKNKYPIINDYIDYYIGLWENAISYFNNNKVSNKKYICHKRVDINMDLYSFLNPLNFIVDYKERDIGDYTKSFVINKKYSSDTFDKYFNSFSRDNIILIIARLLFPSYFFDMYESIIIDKTDEKEILTITEKNKNIILFLKYIFNRFYNENIPYIDWIIKSD